MRHTPRATAFTSPAAFRAWLERHHGAQKELLVRCYKSHARHKGMTHLQALDEALCFGWIDGVRRRLDEDSFSVRFTPRKPNSFWSAVNIKRVVELEAKLRMRPPGLAAFRRRQPNDSKRYSYESRPAALARAYLKKLRSNERAWTFFQAQAPWYRRTSAFWVMSAKRPETRTKRLDVLISSSQRGTTIPLLTRAPRRGVTSRR